MTAGAPASLDLAIDMDSPQIGSSDGERLFADDGKATKFLEDRASMMQALVTGSTEAFNSPASWPSSACSSPCRSKLSSWTVREESAGPVLDRSGRPPELTAPQLVDLRDRKYLEWMYFQMASLAHVSGLVARKNRLISGVAR